MEDIFDLETQVNISVPKITNDMHCESNTSESKKTLTSNTLKSLKTPQLNTSLDTKNEKAFTDLISQPTAVSSVMHKCWERMSQHNSENNTQNQLNLNLSVQHQIHLSENHTNGYSLDKIGTSFSAENDSTEKFKKKNDDDDKDSQEKHISNDDQAQMFSTLTYVNFLLAKENCLSVKEDNTNICLNVLKQNNDKQNNLCCEDNVELLKKDFKLMKSFSESSYSKDEREKENILQAGSKKTNWISDEISGNQSIFLPSKEQTAFKEKKDLPFSKTDGVDLLSPKKNFSDSEGISYLEITIENTIQESIGNNVNSLTHKEISQIFKDAKEFRNFRTRKMEKQCALEMNKERTLGEQYIQNSEMAVDDRSSPSSESDSFICSQYEECINKFPVFNSSSKGLEKDEEFNQSPRDIFQNITSSKNSRDLIYPLVPIKFGSQHDICDPKFGINSGSMGAVSLQHTGKTKFTPMTLTKDLTSFVPETSDDDSTMSDFEIIENTPNYMDSFQDSRTNHELPRVFKSSVNLSKINEFSNYDSQYQNLSLESDKDSNSSYIFEFVNEGKNDGLKEENEKSRKEFTVFETSDSNESDIIDGTPPKKNLVSNKPNSSGVTEENKTETSPLTISNKSPLNDSSLQKKCTSNAERYETFWEINNDSSPRKITNKEKAEKVNSEINSLELIDEILPSESKKCHEHTVNQIAKNLWKSNSIQSKSASVDITRKRTKDEQNIAEVVPVKRSRTVSRLIENHADDQLSGTEKQFLALWKIHNVTPIQQKRIRDSKSFLSEEKTIKSKLSGSINKQKAIQQKFPRANVNSTKVKSDVISNKKNKIACKKLLGVSNTPLNDKPNLSTIESSSDLNKEENEGKELKMPRQNLKNSFSSSEGEKNLLNSSSRNSQEISSIHDKCYFEDFPAKIAFTGLVSPFLENIIDELGGERINDVHLCNALVTDRVYRTVKFLCAIGLGIPITSPQWLLECKNKNKFLNPWNFILKCEESENKWDFDLRSSLEKAKSKKLLDGYSVYATKNVKPPVGDMLCMYLELLTNF